MKTITTALVVLAAGLFSAVIVIAMAGPTPGLLAGFLAYLLWLVWRE